MTHSPSPSSPDASHAPNAPSSPDASHAPEPEDALERAARRLIQDHADLPLESDDRELLRREITAIVNEVRDASRGSLTAPSVAGGLNRLRLLRSLRTGVVEEWSDGDGSPLPIMRGLEAVQARLLVRDEVEGATDVLSPFSRALLGEVSHSLRSPLGALVMLTGTLLEDGTGSLTDRQRHQLGIVHRAATAAAQTTGDLLALWSEEERVERAEAIALHEIMERVAHLVRAVAESRNSDLQVQVGVVGPRSGPGSAVEQVLLALGLRAALGTRDGALEIRATGEGGEGVVFHVNAEGYRPAQESAPGEDAPDPRRIFLVDPDSGTFTLSAEGLGIAAARRLLRSLGSELRVEASGEGSLSMRFRLSLPPLA